MTTLTKLDIADYLETDENIQVFPEESDNICSPDGHQHALKITGRARTALSDNSEQVKSTLTPVAED